MFHQLIQIGKNSLQLGEETVHRIQSMNSTTIIGVIDIKLQDLSAITSLQCARSDGLPFSDGLYLLNGISIGEEQVCILYFFASSYDPCYNSIANAVYDWSNLQVYDISSRYLKSNCLSSRQTYAIIHQNNTQLYQVTVHASNKIQINSKLQPLKTNQIINQSLLKQKQKTTSSKSIFLQLNIQKISKYFKNFGPMINKNNFQQLMQYVKIQQYLQKYLNQQSIGYKNLKNGQKITINEIKQINKIIQNFKNKQKSQQIKPKILEHIIKIIKKQIELLDIELIHKQIKKLKQYYSRELLKDSKNNIINNENIIENILKQYQIPIIYKEFIYSSFTIQKYQNQVLQLSQSLQAKKCIVKQLEMQLTHQKLINKQCMSQIQEHGKKAFIFKQLNQQIIICQQTLDNERSCNKKLKLEIQSYIARERNQLSNIYELQNVLKSTNHEKSQIIETVKTLNNQNFKLLQQVQNYKQNLTQLQIKLQQSKFLESRALQSLQNESFLKQRILQYQDYISKIENNFRTFKQHEINKFNYILNKNAKKYEKLNQINKGLLKQIDIMNEDQRKLQNQMDCQKTKTKHYQQIVFSSIAGVKNIIIQDFSEDLETQRG